MRFTPRPDQTEAIDAIVDKLATESRTQAIMACGTGKTFVSQKAVEQVVADKADSLVLIAVPNLVLVEQMIGEWTRQAAPGHAFAALAVNSRRRGKADPDEITDVDLADVTSDPEAIADFMLSDGRKVIFSTYQSMAHISNALELAAASRPGFQIDVMVLDEAHRTAGVRRSDTPTAFKLALDGEKVPVAKRLFMTATPRISNSKRNDDSASASMDNPVLFGDRAITRSLSWAVTNELLAPYRTYVVQVDNAMLQGVLEANPSLRVGGKAAEAKHVAAAIALAKNAKLNGLGGIITYSSSIAGAKEFGRVLEEVVAALPADQKPAGQLTVNHINGSTPADERDAILGTLDSSGRAAGDWSVVTNCNCLVEGVNVPSMDAIMFVDPRKSIVSIVQAIGRPMRKDKNNPGKIATIVVPVFIGEYENAHEAIEDGAFESVGQTIAALRDVDDALSEKFVEHLVKRDAGENAEFAEVDKAKEGAFATAKLDDPGSVDLTEGDKNERGESLIAFTSSEGELHEGQPEDALIRVMDPVVSAVQREVAIRESVWRDWHHALETTLVDDIASSWECGLAALKSFVQREGHSKVERQHFESGVRLASWIKHRREDYAKGGLERSKIDQLEMVPGWSWSPMNDVFTEGMASLQVFAQREGHAKVHGKHIEGGFNLGYWVSCRRSEYVKGKIDQWIVDALEAIPGWSWNPQDDAFEEGLSSLRNFIQREGHSVVKAKHIEDGFRLGKWVSRRRGSHSRGVLEKSKIDLLENLPGWSWDPLKDSFAEGLRLLLSFSSREGHALVGDNHTEDGFNLGSWVSNRRNEYSNGLLEGSKIDQLESVPGWSWAPRLAAFDNGISSLQSFVQREGNSRVHYLHVENGFKLGAWVLAQRRKYLDGKLLQQEIDVLEAFDGWTWSPMETAFNEGLSCLQSFVQREGHARVHHLHVENGLRLGQWVSNRRADLARGSLVRSKIEQLEAIPGWSWDPFEEDFNHNISLLAKYARQIGHAKVPNRYIEGDFKMGNWVYSNRRSLKKGKLSEERIAKLDAISPSWRNGALAPWESAPGVRKLDEAA